MSTSVRTLKLIGGDEILGQLSHVDSDHVHLENVVIMQRVQHPETGQVVQGFGDYPALAKPGQKIRIPHTAILVMPCETHEQLEREYLKNVTGMELPAVTPKILLS
jgi:hypothetical protein